MPYRTSATRSYNGPMEVFALQIITYPHPTLRYKSKPIKRVDAELVALVRQMFDLMYEAKGIGLAANQVNLPLRLFIVNLEGDPSKGEELVFLNPVLSRPKGNCEHEEGCLSIPGVYGNVSRPKQVHLYGYNLRGEEIDAVIDGMLARCVQHEADHLDGVLFVDRISPLAREDLRAELDDFEVDFDSRRSMGQLPPDAEVLAELAQWERKYC